MYLHFVMQRKMKQQSPSLIEIAKEFQGLEQTYPTLVSCQNVQNFVMKSISFFSYLQNFSTLILKENHG